MGQLALALLNSYNRGCIHLYNLYGILKFQFEPLCTIMIHLVASTTKTLSQLSVIDMLHSCCASLLNCLNANTTARTALIWLFA